MHPRWSCARGLVPNTRCCDNWRMTPRWSRKRLPMPRGLSARGTRPPVSGRAFTGALVCVSCLVTARTRCWGNAGFGWPNMAPMLGYRRPGRTGRCGSKPTAAPTVRTVSPGSVTVTAIASIAMSSSCWRSGTAVVRVPAEDLHQIRPTNYLIGRRHRMRPPFPPSISSPPEEKLS